MRKGFTLVELSIVLVIIGLLIGGILVGQSIIGAAKLQVLVRQLEQYDVAITTFKTKYKAIPGDSRIIYTPKSINACPSKDGLITDDECANNSVTFSSSTSDEIGLVWYDLAQTVNLVIENCKTIATAVPAGGRTILSGTNCNTPKAKYGDSKTNTVLAASYSLGGAPYTTANSQGNAYYLFDCLGMASTVAISCVTTFTQAEAAAYDQKTDDGIPGTGDVRGGTRATVINQLARNVLTYPATYTASDTTNLMGIIRRFPNGL